MVLTPNSRKPKGFKCQDKNHGQNHQNQTPRWKLSASLKIAMSVTYISSDLGIRSRTQNYKNDYKEKHAPCWYWWS